MPFSSAFSRSISLLRGERFSSNPRVMARRFRVVGDGQVFVACADPGRLGHLPHGVRPSVSLV